MNTAPHIKPITTHQACVACVVVWLAVVPISAVGIAAAIYYYLT